MRGFCLPKLSDSFPVVRTSPRIGTRLPYSDAGNTPGRLAELARPDETPSGFIPREIFGAAPFARPMIAGIAKLDATIAQTGVGPASHDDVVEQGDVEQASRGKGFSRQPQVIGRRRDVARRMVVRDDNRRGVKLDCSAE